MQRRRFFVIIPIVVLVIVGGLFGSTVSFLNQRVGHRVERFVTTPEALDLPPVTVHP